MAIPPDPIDEVLPAAQGAVLADVTRVISSEPHTEGVVASKQLVELKVSAVLFGPWKMGTTFEAVKPAGGYGLRAGNKGPFLLREVGGKVQILGDYGPDTYSEAAIRATAAKLGKK